MPTTRPIGHSRRSVRAAAVLLAATLPITAACATEEPAFLTLPPATSTPQDTETSIAATPAEGTAETENADIVSLPTLQDEPVLSEAAQQNSKKGALAFAEYWRELLVYTNLSGVTTPLFEASSIECEYCISLSQEMTEYSRSSKIITGYDYAYTAPAEIVKSSENAFLIKLNALQSTYRVQHFPASTETPDEDVEISEETQVAALIIVWEDKRWKAFGYGPFDS